MPGGKVAPLPKSGSTAAVPSGAKAPPAPQGGGVKAKTGPRPKLFDTTRFVAATRDLSIVPKSRGQGTLSAIIFVAAVGLGLIGFGIALVVVGEDNYIVDVMTFGGICLFMGVFAIIMGFLFVIRPIQKAREEERTMALERANQQQAPADGTSGLPGAASYQEFQYVNPAHLTDDFQNPRSSGSLVPPDEDLYKGRRDGPSRASFNRGQTLTPPPLLSQPLKDRPGTTSTELTTSDYPDMMQDNVSEKDEESVRDFTLGPPDGLDGGKTTPENADEPAEYNNPTGIVGGLVLEGDASARNEPFERDDASEKDHASEGNSASGRDNALEGDDPSLKQMLRDIAIEKDVEVDKDGSETKTALDRAKTWERDTAPEGDFVVDLKTAGNLRSET
ncbi:hypothetical protein BaRGS_00030971 [Batillaria attramentaria]|uniref:Uncharacterized protein n=1 Tax=Batillaria attramentaria TaxID=370345 RepID=A0ABD0JRS6_9CAEN